MLDWGGYLLLAVATVLGGSAAGDPDPAWRRRPSRIAAVGGGVAVRRLHPPAAAERRPPRAARRVLRRAARPRLDPDAPPAAVLHLHDRGLLLRHDPAPAAARGRRHRGHARSSSTRLIAGVPQTPEAWTFYLAIIVVQTVVISAGAVFGEKVTEQNEERRQALARLEAALERERRPPRPAAHAGPRGGHPRRAAADGPRDPRHDRPGPDRDRHPARGGRPGARPAGGPGPPPRQRRAAGPREPDRGAPLGRGVDARPRSSPGRCRTRSPTSRANGPRSTAIPVDVTVTGDVIALHPEIEVALLRTAQEALAERRPARRRRRAPG